MCEKQCRDDNGFKCHVASESHVRNMMVVGENSKKFISDFSSQFQRDFIQLLRTGHGEKKINANHFYNEYISNKAHTHLNATRWNSLTEFIKHLGREGIVKVHDDEKAQEGNQKGAAALMISWIDNSPEALRRQDALKKRERQDRGDEQREQRLIEEQIRKARGQRGEIAEDESGDEQEDSDEGMEPVQGGIKRTDREKISLSFGPKKSEHSEKPPSPPLTDESTSPENEGNSADQESAVTAESQEQKEESPAKVLIKPLSLSGAPKAKNVFAAAGKKNILAGPKKPALLQQQRPMSEAERIMKEEMERKRKLESRGAPQAKKQRVF